MAPWTGKGKDTRPLSQPTSKPTDTDGNDPAPSDAPRTTEKSFFSKLKNKVKKGNPLAPTAEQNTTSAPREQHLAADNVRASHAQHAKDSSLAGVTVKPTDRREALDGLAHAARRSATSALPGEWELDPTFLAALSKWDREHPHNTLNNVLQNVSKAIEKGKPLIGIIPDTPFPAQSLVKGLAQVIQLGAMLSDADLKLQDFALGVAEWLTDLKTQIASLDNEAFAAVAWENLAKVREIVDKICNWAVSRLADGRWTKLDMEAEIAEFKARVEEARQIFHDRALMTISKHIFVLQNTLENIQKAHKTQDEEIAAEKARRETLHRALDPHTAARPTYDQQGKLPCDAGSRTEVLETIRRWIHDHSDKSQNFLWLTGDPGCGKSAVTTTIAQEGKDGRFLWAQYFINRNLEHTTDPNMYFPTIARQLSDLSNKVERHVHDTVVKAPSVTDQISSGQAVELFIGAIAKASNANPGTPVLIVIDGLDETDKSHLSTTAKIFSQLFEKLSDHRNAKILISSRTEHQIHKPFSAALTSAHVKRIHLDTRDPSCLQDVERFIRGRLHEVAVDHDLDPTLWPGKEREERLNEKAEGLYIWAVTVTKFLDARLRKQGRENPYGVIDQLQLPNKANISVLYQRILQVTYDDDDDDPTEWDLETFRRIVGAIIVAREPLSVAQLDDLLHLSHTPSSRHRVDLRNFVQLLRTVLVSGMESVTGATVVRLHKSFFEYITTNAEERFRIDLEAANAEMALCCLQHVVESHAIVASTQFAHAASDVKTLPYPTRYALRFGLSHVTRRNGQRLGIVLDNPAVTLAQFNAAISCSPHTSPLIISIQNDPSVITTSFHTHALIWDVDNGSPITPITIPANFPWQLIFSPDGKDIGNVNSRGCNWIDAQTFRRARSQPLDSANKSTKHGVSFSSQGTMCAAAEGHNQISLWDSLGNNMGSFQRLSAPKYLSYHSVAFASDGIHLVCAAVDGVQIWNVQTHALVRRIDVSLPEYLPVTLSPDGSWILSSTDSDHSLILWDYHTCTQIGEPFKGHTQIVRSTVISPNSKYIVSASDDLSIRLWDVATHQQLGESWGPCTHQVWSVSFSPDGSHVLSVSTDGFQLWEVPTGRTLARVRLVEKDLSEIVRGVISPDGQYAVVGLHNGKLAISNISPYTFHIKDTFSAKWSALSIPKGNLFISLGFDNTLFLSRLDSGKFGGRPLPRNNPQVTVHSVLFSPDERYIAGVCEDGEIYLWSAEDYTLIATHRHDLARGIPSLSFTHDSTGIAVNFAMDKYLLTPVENYLMLSNDISSIQEASSVLIQASVMPHVYNNSSNRRLQNVRWYPTDSDDILWAYINNHIVRAGEDGRFVIMPVDAGAAN